MPEHSQEVVAGALFVDGKLLLAERAHPPELAGYWELPGGKVEPGEEPRAALARELREELGIDVRVGQRIGADVPLRPAMVLRAYRVDLVSGTPQALEHGGVRWVDAAELAQVRLVPADQIWVPDLEAALRKLSAPHWTSES